MKLLPRLVFIDFLDGLFNLKLSIVIRLCIDYVFAESLYKFQRELCEF